MLLGEVNIFNLLLSFWFRCYRGYCFESLATEDPRRADGEGIHHIDANVEYCSVVKTKLGAHRILMGAEMDCCDSTDDGRRFYVELKTNREVEMHIIFCWISTKILTLFILYWLVNVCAVGLSYWGKIWERETAQDMGKVDFLIWLWILYISFSFENYFLYAWECVSWWSLISDSACIYNIDILI